MVFEALVDQMGYVLGRHGHREVGLDRLDRKEDRKDFSDQMGDVKVLSTP